MQLIIGWVSAMVLHAWDLISREPEWEDGE